MNPSSKLRLLPIVWICAWFGTAIVASFLFPSGADSVLERSLRGPAQEHLLGFDALGKDLQISLLIASIRSGGFAFLAVLISCATALAAGSLIAMAPARSQFIALRILDSFLAFPSLLLALAWAAIRGPGWDTLIVSMLIGILPSFVRLVYARSREILGEPYVSAAQSMGATSSRILMRHLLPAQASLCAVKAPLLFAQALMAEATLTFLGIGAPIGNETWGSLLATGKDYLFEAPHIAISAGVPLTLTVLSLQLIAQVRSRNPAAN